MVTRIADRQLPDPDDPASFPAYLRRSARRWRVRTGSSVRYELTVAVLWFGFGPAIGTWQGLTSPVPADPPLTWAAGVAVLVGGLALVALGAIAAGPVTVPFEYRVWVLSTPLDRAAVLRRPLARALAATATAGAVINALVADGIGARDLDAMTVLLLGAAAGVITGAGAVVAQTAVSRAPGLAARWTAVAMLGGAVALNLLSLRPPPAGTLWVVAAALVVAASWFARVAAHATAQIPLPRLTAGAGLSPAAGIAAQEQSLAPLAAMLIPADRRPAPIRLERPLTGAGPAAWAAADRRLAVRNTPALVRGLVLIVVPYLATPLLQGIGWWHPALALVVLLCAVGAISAYADTVRRFAASPGLAARYGLDRVTAGRTAMRIPTVAAVVFAAATAPLLIAVGLPLSALVVPAVALGLVASRANQAPYEAGFVQGAVYSQDLVRRFLRGPGALLLGSVLVIVTGLARVG